MLRIVVLILLSLQLVLSFSTATFASSSQDEMRVVSRNVAIVHVDKRLRSAFLQRVAVPGTYRPALSADGNVAELQSHFDAVLDILKTHEARALEIALNRLEKVQGKSWTSVDRAHWLEKLSERRAVQITRLELYRQRGLFPQNEHDTHAAVPVFVDNYGTDCAVGHLMRESGAGKLTDLIARTNNLVYVSDVFGGAIVKWIAHSGLTQEEAALIQPGYTPPSADALFSELGLEGSVQHGGLRYENFKILAGKQIFGNSIESINPFPIDTSQASVSIDNEIYSAPCCEYVELATGFGDWLYFSTGRNFDSETLSNNANIVELVYSYDVVAIGSNDAISAASTVSQFSFGGNRSSIDFSDSSRGNISVETTIRSGPFASYGFGKIEATLYFETSDDSYNSFFSDGDFSYFSPQKSINVKTRVLLEDEWTFSSLIHTFELVPEPSSLVLCLFPALFCSMRRMRRKSNT